MYCTRNEFFHIYDGAANKPVIERWIFGYRAPQSSLKLIEAFGKEEKRVLSSLGPGGHALKQYFLPSKVVS